VRCILESTVLTPSSSSSIAPPISYSPIGTDLLTNGDFSQDMTAWAGPVILMGGVVASGAATGGLFTFNITSIESNPEHWHLQLTQDDILLENGNRYAIEVVARADAPRELEVVMMMKNDPYDTYHSNTILNLTTSYMEYHLEFDMLAPTDPIARLAINAGAATPDIYIQEIHLYKLEL
jgi:hypothetical protein